VQVRRTSEEITVIYNGVEIERFGYSHNADRTLALYESLLGE